MKHGKRKLEDERSTVLEEVFKLDLKTLEHVPTSLSDLNHQITLAMHKIPIEYKSNAKITFEINDADFSPYGSTHYYLIIWYSRPETDEEITERICRDKESQHHVEQLERAELRRLQEKYGEE